MAPMLPLHINNLECSAHHGIPSGALDRSDPGSRSITLLIVMPQLENRSIVRRIKKLALGQGIHYRTLLTYFGSITGVLDILVFP